MIGNKTEYLNAIDRASEFIAASCSSKPQICIVLGSGLGKLASLCEIDKEIPYTDIPGFPVSTAPGHAGRLYIAEVSGKRCYMLGGRFHYYEGYDPEIITFYVRVMARLGVKTLVLTNAAGGILECGEVPCLMIIEDHISFLAESPLRGANLDAFGVRFPDQTHVYDQEYIGMLEECADTLGINVLKGIYAYTRGPQYETPAEIRALKILGADAVGMSTVPEAIAASHCGMRVAAVSCISNLAAGISKTPLSEEEVLQMADRISNDDCALIKEFIKRL